MAVPVIIAVNLTATPVDLLNLGALVPASGQVTLSDANTTLEIQNDSQLIAALDAGTLALSINGTILSASQSAAYATPGDPATSPLKNNFTAVLGPTAVADSTAGYSVGSRWVNTLLNQPYVCTNATPGLAQWSVNTGGPVSLDAFGAYDSTGGQTFTATTITVNLNVERFVSSANYTLLLDQVTILTAGRYWISYSASVENSAGNRTQGQSWLERNTVEIAGTRGELYCRQVNHGASAGVSFPVNLTAGSVLRIRATRTEGSGTLRMETNGSSLSLLRIG